MKSAQIWIQYINFETQMFHMGFSFLLCFAAIQTPLLQIDEIYQKYTEQLNSYYDNIVEEFNQADFDKSIPEKYQELYKQLEPHMKQPSIPALQNLMVTDLYPKTKMFISER